MWFESRWSLKMNMNVPTPPHHTPNPTFVGRLKIRLHLTNCKACQPDSPAKKHLLYRVFQSLKLSANKKHQKQAQTSQHDLRCTPKNHGAPEAQQAPSLCVASWWKLASNTIQPFFFESRYAWGVELWKVWFYKVLHHYAWVAVVLRWSCYISNKTFQNIM